MAIFLYETDCQGIIVFLFNIYDRIVCFHKYVNFDSLQARLTEL